MPHEHQDAFEAYLEKARSAFGRLCASLHATSPDAQKTCKAVISNTTILALTCTGRGNARDAIIACDGLTSVGYEKYIINTDKIDQLDRHSAMASCGYAAPAMQATRYLRALFRIAKLLDKKDLSAKGKARQVNNLVGEYFSYQDYYFLPIFLSYDTAQHRARIFDIWGGGGYKEWENYYANGCGGDAALAELERHWTERLSRKDAIHLAIRAVHQAAHKTHGANEPQYVRILTAQGLEDVPRSAIQRTLDGIRKKCKRCKEDKQGGIV